MKRKLLKAMACAMSVCMLSMSLAGCGDDSSQSSTPGSSTPGSSTPSSNTPDSTPDDSQGDDEQGGVVDKSDGLFPAYDLGGITLTLLAHNDLGGKNPDAEGLEDYVQAERQEHKDYIEQKYNVKLVWVAPPTDDWEELNNQIVMDYNSGSPTADIMDAYYQHMATYVSNNILYDFTSDFAKSSQFDETSFFSWMGSQWGISSGIGGEGLYYNKEWIKNLGMEYTPAEMFDRGLWDYENFNNYLLQMKSLMNDDEYPLYVAPYYWMLFATAANGEIMLDPSGNLNYTTDAFIEIVEEWVKLFNDGLIGDSRQYGENGELTSYNTWNYAGDTFDQGNTIAMAHRASWQVAGNSNFELGFVPYPWGKNVTIGHTGDPGDYLTLSDNYASAYFDGQLICMVKSVADKADPMQVMSMLLELMGWSSKMSAYVQDESQRSGGDWLEDGLDKDLYFYSLGKERLEPFNSLDMDITLAPNGMCFGGLSVRSSLESYYNQDMQTMIDNGFAPESVFTPYEIEEEGSEE